MAEAIEDHQIQNQNQPPDHTDELGFHKTTSDSADANNIQNPNQNPPKSDDSAAVHATSAAAGGGSDDDEKAIEIIGEELRSLVLHQALNEEREKRDADVEANGDDVAENGVTKEVVHQIAVEGDDLEGGGYRDERYADVEFNGDYGDDDRYKWEGDEERSWSGTGDENNWGNEIENDNENENGFEGFARDGGFDANRVRRKFGYPLRPDAQDCPYYMKTGMCKFGSNCKFNHPYKRKNQQGTKEKGKQKEENQEMPGQIECKYYLTAGGCKYGKACKYTHNREKGSVPPIVEFNFLGLPIRPGEKECPYYMRTVTCKYGSNCRFHHPDPSDVAGAANASSGYRNAGAVPVPASSRSAVSSWSSLRALSDTVPYVPMVFPPTQGIASPTPEWNGYQAPVYSTSEKRLPIPPAFAMSTSATKTDFYPRAQQAMLIEEYPERPGQPECSYFIKTGDCKYKSTCKFHHPKSRISKGNPNMLNDKGLPLRPDQAVCSFYSRYGICKFGPACKFDHPENYGGSASSVESSFDQSQQSQMSLGWQGRELQVDH